VSPAAIARLAAAGALVSLAGCHPRLPPPDLSLDPAALLAEVRAAQAAVVSVRGRARVTVDSPGGGGGTEQELVAERPGRLRVEVYDFFGNVLAVLAVDGGRLALYDARARTFARGAATPTNLARLLPVALSPAELVTLLCGSAPLIDGQPVSAEPGDGRVLLTLQAGDRRQLLEVGAGAVLLGSRQIRAGADGETPDGLEARFSDHRPRGGQPTPTEVIARLPASGVGLSLRWRELEVNQPVDPSLFGLSPPAGARVVDLDPPPP
jgi:outer membrane lipoprotein-sorting protein